MSTRAHDIAKEGEGGSSEGGEGLVLQDEGGELEVASRDALKC